MTKSRQLSKNINKTNLVSLPFSNENTDTKLILKDNNDFELFKIIGKETNPNTKISINDEILYVKFSLNLKGRKAFVIKHLRIVNLEKENNAEIIFSKNIFSNIDIYYLSPIYRSFINEFIKKNGYRI